MAENAPTTITLAHMVPVAQVLANTDPKGVRIITNIGENGEKTNDIADFAEAMAGTAIETEPSISLLVSRKALTSSGTIHVPGELQARLWDVRDRKGLSAPIAAVVWNKDTPASLAAHVLAGLASCERVKANVIHRAYHIDHHIVSVVVDG